MNNGIHVSFSVLVSSGYMPKSGIAGSYGGFIPSFLRNLHTFFHSSCITFPPTVQECFLFSTPSPTFIVCRLFHDGHADWYEVVVVLICISLLMSNVEHLFMCLLAICMSSWRNVCLGLFLIFLTRLFVFLVLRCMSCLYILEIDLLSVVSSLLFSPILRVAFSPCL